MSKKQSSWKDKLDPAVAILVKSYIQLLDSVNPPDSKTTDKMKKKVTNSELRSFKLFYGEYSDQTLSKSLAGVMRKMQQRGMTHETFRDELGKALNGELVLYILFVFLDMVSQLTYKKSLKTLYEEARAEKNDESLFRLLRFDKTLFDHEWLRERMLQEMFMPDYDFFKKLGNALKGDPPIEKMRKGKLKFVLYAFWLFGLYKLTIPELAQFLEDCGFEITEDLETFRKFVNREVKPTFKPL